MTACIDLNRLLQLIHTASMILIALSQGINLPRPFLWMKAQYLDILESGKTIGLEIILPKTVMNKALKAIKSCELITTQQVFQANRF